MPCKWLGMDVQTGGTDHGVMLPFDGIWLAAALVALLIAIVSALIVNRVNAADRHQQRLSRAFSRASRVQGAGTGEQGKPYSLYGPRSWNDR